MTETIPTSTEPGFFQKIGKSFDHFVYSGKEVWNNLWTKIGEAGTKFGNRVIELRDGLIEKSKPLQERIAASGLHQTVENLKGHVETVKQVFATARAAMGSVELKATNRAGNPERISELKASIKSNRELIEKCKQEARKHYERAVEIRKARQEIQEADKAWLKEKGVVVAEKWNKLDLGGRWDRAKKSLAEAIANKLDAFAAGLRQRNANIGSERSVIAATP